MPFQLCLVSAEEFWGGVRDAGWHEKGRKERTDEVEEDEEMNVLGTAAGSCLSVLHL